MFDVCLLFGNLLRIEIFYLSIWRDRSIYKRYARVKFEIRIVQFIYKPSYKAKEKQPALKMKNLFVSCCMIRMGLYHRPIYDHRPPTASLVRIHWNTRSYRAIVFERNNLRVYGCPSFSWESRVM